MILIALIGSVQRLLAVALLGLGICVVLQAALMPYGRDGADEMAVVVTLPIAMLTLIGAPDLVAEVVLFFIACQLSLSYLAAGVAKGLGSYWRDGSALNWIARTATYGEPRLARTVERIPALGNAASRGILAWEIAMPISIVIGGPVAFAMLASGVGFHLGIAYFMGLNRFLVWFLSAYPAAAFVASSYGLWD